MTIPSHHDLGDIGHTDDHDDIVDVLSGHAGTLSAYQTAFDALPGTYLAKIGNNTLNVSSPAGYAERIVIPAGSRDDAAYVWTVTYGGKYTFGLDTYGQARAGAAQDAGVPLEVFGSSSSQSADLTRWRKTGSSGTVVSRVDANGNVYAPNLTPSAWTLINLASGIVPDYDLGSPPAYRTIGDMVYVRGAIKKSNGSGFSSNPVDVGTLPSGYRPPCIVFAVTGSHFIGNFGQVRMEVNTNGLIRFYFPASQYQPTWVSLDGIQFSRTPGP